jgi:hypothetical protein
MFRNFSPLREGARKLEILGKGDIIMRTINGAIQNRWPLKQTQRLLVLLMAVTLVGINAGRGLVAASSKGTRSDVVLGTTTVRTLNGTFQVIDNLPGAVDKVQLDCNLVAYDAADIEYFDFTTNTYNLMPAAGRGDHVSDLAGGQIAFITYRSFEVIDRRVEIFDTVSQTFTYIGPDATMNASIGGTLVAFEDRALDPDFNDAQITVYDQSTGATTQLASGDQPNRNPRVSPTGNAVVWEQWQHDGTGCAIYSAVQTSPGTFQTTLLTGAGQNRGPATNGAVVVYISDKSGENDIYYQPVGGGAETHLAIPGDQRNVSISGDLIAFESQGQQGYDVFVYDLRTGNLYQVTNTPLLDETLGDISVCNGTGRIAYTVPDAGGIDVDAFTFQVPNSTAEQIDNLAALVNSFNLPDGSANSLITKLQDALAANAASDIATACDSLTAFINECQAQSAKKLTADQATQLINSANQIKTGLGCQ